MLSAIREIKVNGPCMRSRAALLAASAELATAGARLQIVACSEFSIIANSVAPGVRTVDTIDLLTDAIVRTSQAT